MLSPPLISLLGAALASMTQIRFSSLPNLRTYLLSALFSVLLSAVAVHAVHTVQGASSKITSEKTQSVPAICRLRKNLEKILYRVTKSYCKRVDIYVLLIKYYLRTKVYAWCTRILRVAVPVHIYTWWRICTDAPSVLKAHTSS